jgi:hypothetical protein
MNIAKEGMKRNEIFNADRMTNAKIKFEDSLFRISKKKTFWKKKEQIIHETLIISTNIC